MMKALMATDLPDPVEPAISRWGMVFSSAVTMRPLMSLPIESVVRDLLSANSRDSMISRSQMVSRLALGTCTPTVDLPAMRSISTLSAFRAREISSFRPVMRESLMPASGLNSKVVTTGPGLICVTWPCTSNSAHFSGQHAGRCAAAPPRRTRCGRQDDAAAWWKAACNRLAGAAGWSWPCAPSRLVR